MANRKSKQEIPIFLSNVVTMKEDEHYFCAYTEHYVNKNVDQMH
jgi:hypothetical protein